MAAIYRRFAGFVNSPAKMAVDWTDWKRRGNQPSPDFPEAY